MTITPSRQGRPCAVVVLAAGEGSRMRSDLAKPLHKVAGASMLRHALRTAQALSPTALSVVVGHGGPAVAAEALAAAPGAVIVPQPVRRGTGDAARLALAALDGFSGVVVVLYADTPLLRPETLAALTAAAEGGGVAVLGFEPSTPGGYGRLILDADGALARIVEAADATDSERAARLCNSGVTAFDAVAGRRWLAGLSSDNAKGEFYLTDIVAAARAEGRPCVALACDAIEALGVNDRADLAAVEAAFQTRARVSAMADGATLTAPQTAFFAWDTVLGRDVTVGPNVVFGPGVTVADGAEIRAFCHLEGCAIGRGAIVGPFARLRPGARIGAGAHVGNFVEIKNATLGDGAKANHLAYVGDAAVGAGANIGAGAITCNYDGVSKHRTEIGEGAFIGSNSALVAPVSIGARAYVASGSVVTRDVAPDALAIGRARQQDKPGLAARLRGQRAGGRADGGRRD